MTIVSFLGVKMPLVSEVTSFQKVSFSAMLLCVTNSFKDAIVSIGREPIR